MDEFENYLLKEIRKLQRKEAAYKYADMTDKAALAKAELEALKRALSRYRQFKAAQKGYY